MNGEIVVASRLLTQIAGVNESFISLYLMLRSKPGVSGVTHGFEIRPCGAETLIEIFVEAETKNDQAYCWWLEVRFMDREWKIETSLLNTHEGKQSTIKRFTERSGTALDEFLMRVQDSSREIMSSAQSFAFEE